MFCNSYKGEKDHFHERARHANISRWRRGGTLKFLAEMERVGEETKRTYLNHNAMMPFLLALPRTLKSEVHTVNIVHMQTDTIPEHSSLDTSEFCRESWQRKWTQGPD